MCWNRERLKTHEGKKKYAETVIAIAEKVLVNTFLLLGGTYAVDVVTKANHADFGVYLWIASIGMILGMFLLLKGTCDYDKLCEVKQGSADETK